jgi:hypothetical protein
MTPEAGGFDRGTGVSTSRGALGELGRYMYLGAGHTAGQVQSV